MAIDSRLFQSTNKYNYIYLILFSCTVLSWRWRSFVLTVAIRGPLFYSDDLTSGVTCLRYMASCLSPSSPGTRDNEARAAASRQHYVVVVVQSVSNGPERSNADIRTEIKSSVDAYCRLLQAIGPCCDGSQFRRFCGPKVPWSECSIFRSRRFYFPTFVYSDGPMDRNMRLCVSTIK